PVPLVSCQRHTPSSIGSRPCRRPTGRTLALRGVRQLTRESRRTTTSTNDTWFTLPQVSAGASDSRINDGSTHPKYKRQWVTAIEGVGDFPAADGWKRRATCRESDVSIRIQSDCLQSHHSPTIQLT